MRKNINKKIFLTALLAFCSITLVWTGAAMAEHTKITNKTQSTVVVNVNHTKKGRGHTCTKPGNYRTELRPGQLDDRQRSSGCKIESIRATPVGGTSCQGVSNSEGQDFEIRGDMNKCQVVRTN